MGSEKGIMMNLDSNRIWLSAMAVILLLVSGCSERDISGPDDIDECYGFAVKSVSSRVNQTFRDIFFANELDGWAVGGGGTISATSDGGVTWQTQASGHTKTLYGVHFVNADTGWAVGAEGTIMKTTNGGSTWAVGSNGTVALTDIHAYDTRLVWAVGDSIIISTDDGGVTWADHDELPIAIPVLYRVEFVDRNRGWTVGMGKTILHTSDGGRSYAPQTIGVGYHLVGLDMVDASYGWAVGVGGMILHTSDGGHNWNRQNVSTALVLHGVGFYDRNIGFVVGDSGKVFGTFDGGESWEEVDSGTNKTLRQVFFVDGSTAYACGEYGTMVRITRAIVDCPDY
jgi:photosystem II stability/assembly factor-like uncharacterized protein